MVKIPKEYAEFINEWSCEIAQQMTAEQWDNVIDHFIRNRNEVGTKTILALQEAGFNDEGSKLIMTAFQLGLEVCRTVQHTIEDHKSCRI